MPTFATLEPIIATINVVGDVRVTASDRTDTVVVVRPRNPAKAADVRAAEQTRVELVDGELLVKMVKSWKQFTPLGGGESVEVTIDLPTGSRIHADSGMGDFRAEGELGDCHFKTAMGAIRLDQTGALHAVSSFGDIAVDRVEGQADITASSGDVRLGAISGALEVKSSNGRVEIDEVGGALRVKAANGAIHVGRAHSSATAKTAAGDVRIDDVRSGTVVLETAIGEIEVGIHDGVAAWLDVRSSMGVVRNSLDEVDGPPRTSGTVEVRGRTSMGDVLIHRAPAPTDAAPTDLPSDLPSDGSVTGGAR
jgi:hypothetical protein